MSKQVNEFSLKDVLDGKTSKVNPNHVHVVRKAYVPVKVSVCYNSYYKDRVPSFGLPISQVRRTFDIIQGVDSRG